MVCCVVWWCVVWWCVCCFALWCVVCGVSQCVLSIVGCCGVCTVVWCVVWCCTVEVRWWGSGGASVWEECSLPCLPCLRCLLAFLLSLPLSFSSFVGGVRGSARAALRARTLSPNTTVFFFLPVSSFLLLPVFFLHPSFLVFGMAVCVYHVSVCCVGMTATGSLSLSSAFFW